MVAVFIAAVSCIAVTVFPPLRYIAGLSEVTLFGTVVSLATLSIVAYLVYVVSNQISAQTRPPGAWAIDFFLSALASASLTVTSFHVWRASPFSSLEQLLNLPMDVLALFAVTLYSGFDVTYNQLASWRQAAAALGGLVLAGIFAAVVALLLVLMFGVNIKDIGRHLGTSAVSCRTLEETSLEKTPYGYDKDGIYDLTATLKWRCRPPRN